jgi:hypothetical protein
MGKGLKWCVDSSGTDFKNIWTITYRSTFVEYDRNLTRNIGDLIQIKAFAIGTIAVDGDADDVTLSGLYHGD